MDLGPLARLRLDLDRPALPLDPLDDAQSRDLIESLEKVLNWD